MTKKAKPSSALGGKRVGRDAAAARDARDTGDDDDDIRDEEDDHESQEESVPKSAHTSLRSVLYALGIVAVMGALLYLVHPKALELDADAISHATSFVAVALMISLFMERALEVFVGVWRNPDLVALEAELERIAQWLTDASKSAERAALLDQQSLLSRRRIRYKGETQTFALRASFFAGLLISVAGLRCLQGLVKLGPHEELSIQRFLFQLVDVLLTGGLIAGGSEGLHKIAQVYTTFIDTTNKRLREGAAPSSVSSISTTSSASFSTSTSTTPAVPASDPVVLP